MHRIVGFIHQHVSSCSIESVNRLLGAIQLNIDAQRFYKKVPRPGNPRLYDRNRYKYDFEKLTADAPDYTHKPLKVKRLGGRLPETGRKINMRVGGGIPWDYFLVDIRRYGPTTEGSFYEEKILEIRKDPNRTSFIALAAGTKGRRWIFATENMKPGDVIKTSSFVPKVPVRASEGDAWPVGALALGTSVNCVESFPGQGGAAEVLKKTEAGMVIIKLPSKREIAVNENCMATVGRLSNIEHQDYKLSGVREMRLMGRKQRSGLWHRKDGYAGRKIRPLSPLKQITDPFPQSAGRRMFTLSYFELNAVFGTSRPHGLLNEG